MHITKDFVFIHIPKTGGTAVTTTIKQEYRRLKHTSPHESIHNVKVTLPILAFVRNPYDWYVSWYHALQQRPKGSSVLFDLINTNNFKRDLNTLFDIFEDGGVAWYKPAPHSNTEYANKDTFKQSADWNNCGLLAWHYHWQVFGNEPSQHDYSNVTIGKLETRTEDQLRFLKKLDILTPRAQELILENKRSNTSEHVPDYREYYDDALVERVLQKEQYIIDKYNYKY